MAAKKVVVVVVVAAGVGGVQLSTGCCRGCGGWWCAAVDWLLSWMVGSRVKGNGGGVGVIKVAAVGKWPAAAGCCDGGGWCSGGAGCRRATAVVHSRGKALAKDVDFDKIARTPGFTGADMRNLMNEATILQNIGVTCLCSLALKFLTISVFYI
nr:ATP-dependent zinc metalloprotease FTSH, chloroplastic [Tanacetum cinerariifolium]